VDSTALLVAVASTGQERGNPRFYALIENAPKTGKSPTIWAWPQITEFLKVASQPVKVHGHHTKTCALILMQATCL